MNRPRRSSRKNWPDYLSARTRSKGLYYTWKHPHTGKEYGLGYEFADAAAQAREANLKIMQTQTSKATLIDRIDDTKGNTLSAWLDIFITNAAKRKSRKKTGGFVSQSTIDSYRKRCAVIGEHFKGSLIDKITTRECSAFIQTFQDKGFEKAALDYKTFLVDVFKEAESAGWIPRGTNPASLLKVQKPETKRSRLSEENFKTILDNASGWSKTALLLAIVTGQRVSDIAAMTYEMAHDGFLHVQQIKTGARIKIPLDLSLLGWSIRSIIKDSRRVIGAKAIVHQSEITARSGLGDSISDISISRSFMLLLREHVKKNWSGTPPSFHEIRALSKSLHTANGIDTLELLGHDSVETGRIYSDPRGGWVEVKIPKSA